jgi:hypothetical protein
VTERRHILVLPDRDAAEEVADTVRESFPLAAEPHLVREALAGEDDAEDAQWLVVVEDPQGRLVPDRLAELAEAHDGWRERDCPATPGASLVTDLEAGAGPGTGVVAGRGGPWRSPRCP